MPLNASPAASAPFKAPPKKRCLTTPVKEEESLIDRMVAISAKLDELLSVIHEIADGDSGMNSWN